MYLLWANYKHLQFVVVLQVAQFVFSQIYDVLGSDVFYLDHQFM